VLHDIQSSSRGHDDDADEEGQPLITGLTYNEGMAFSTYRANDTTPPDEPVPPLGSALACGSIREAR